MRMSSVLPATLCLAWFIRWAARQAWLLGILANLAGSVVRSQQSELAWLMSPGPYKYYPK